jgi:hypothetical protein
MPRVLILELSEAMWLRYKHRKCKTYVAFQKSLQVWLSKRILYRSRCCCERTTYLSNGRASTLSNRKSCDTERLTNPSVVEFWLKASEVAQHPI